MKKIIARLLSFVLILGFGSTLIQAETTGIEKPGKVQKGNTDVQIHFKEKGSTVDPNNPEEEIEVDEFLSIWYVPELIRFQELTRSNIEKVYGYGVIGEEGVQGENKVGVYDSEDKETAKNLRLGYGVLDLLDEDHENHLWQLSAEMSKLENIKEGSEDTLENAQLEWKPKFTHVREKSDQPFSFEVIEDGIDEMFYEDKIVLRAGGDKRSVMQPKEAIAATEKGYYQAEMEDLQLRVPALQGQRGQEYEATIKWDLTLKIDVVGD